MVNKAIKSIISRRIQLLTLSSSSIHTNIPLHIYSSKPVHVTTFLHSYTISKSTPTPSTIYFHQSRVSSATHILYFLINNTYPSFLSSTPQSLHHVIHTTTILSSSPYSFTYIIIHFIFLHLIFDIFSQSSNINSLHTFNFSTFTTNHSFKHLTNPKRTQITAHSSQHLILYSSLNQTSSPSHSHLHIPIHLTYVFLHRSRIYILITPHLTVIHSHLHSSHSPRRNTHVCEYQYSSSSQHTCM